LQFWFNASEFKFLFGRLKAMKSCDIASPQPWFKFLFGRLKVALLLKIDKQFCRLNSSLAD